MAESQPTLFDSEKWSPIPGYEGLYEASNQGRVRSVDREIKQKNGIVRRQPGKILSPAKNREGRLQAVLSREGVTKAFFVHRLVLEAFVGPCPEGMECCHWNDLPYDNRLENLRWGTRAENGKDRARNTLRCKWGHPLVPENLYINETTGVRTCRKCKNDRKRKYSADKPKVKREPKPPKTECTHGHRLIEPNLERHRLKQGRKECLACERTRVWVRRRPSQKPHFKEIADQNYEQIMK